MWQFENIMMARFVSGITDTMYLHDNYYLIDKIIILISYLSMEPNTIEQTHVTHLDKNKCSKCGFKSKSHK